MVVVVVVVVVDGVCVAPERGKASGIVGNLITTSFQEKKKDPGNENDECRETGDLWERDLRTHLKTSVLHMVRNYVVKESPLYKFLLYVFQNQMKF